MSQHRLLVSALTLVSLLAAQAVVAQIYTWKDASGRTHYSDQPPPDAKTPVGNKPAAATPRAPEASKPASAPAADAGKPAAAQSGPATQQSGPKTWQERDQEYKQRKTNEQEAAAKRKEEADRAEEKKRYCDGLRGNLAMLERGGRIAKLDANGERSFMEDEQIKREAERVRSQIARDCK